MADGQGLSSGLKTAPTPAGGGVGVEGAWATMSHDQTNHPIPPP
jgi:hypothetical protein